jgi:hypothetical protein
MLFLKEEEINDIKILLDGYTKELDEIDKNSDNYDLFKYELDCKFCGLDIWEDALKSNAELYLGNVIIENNILTCIFNNKLHRYKMVQRKAYNNEYVYITNSNDCLPFNTKYIGRCFKVDSQPTQYSLGDTKNHVRINEEGLDTGWCLYDSQYVVLEEIERYI